MFLFVGVQAQHFGSHAELVNSEIEFKGHEIDHRFITINYEIPHNGVVEIRLFDEMGKQLWQNQYVNTFGKNKIRLKTSVLKAGEMYAYTINYKQDEVRETLIIPVGGQSD